MWDFGHWWFWWDCTDSPADGESHQCTLTTYSPSWHNLYVKNENNSKTCSSSIFQSKICKCSRTDLKLSLNITLPSILYIYKFKNNNPNIFKHFQLSMHFLILTHESYLLIHKVFKRENKASNEHVGVNQILVNLLDELVKL